MTWYDVNFGSHKAGLGTVGYREVNNVGGDAVARTGVGVVDAGDGMYGVDVALNAATVSIQWDTGEAVPIFAVESINLLANIEADIAGVKAVVDLILVDTTQLLLDTAALNAQNVLILADTASIIAQNVLILIDTTQLLLDTAAIQAQNVLIFADTQMLRDIEDGFDIREILRLITASAAGELSGAEPGSNTITLRSLDGGLLRQVTTVDISGNRTAIISRDLSP